MHLSERRWVTLLRVQPVSSRLSLAAAAVICLRRPLPVLAGPPRPVMSEAVVHAYRFGTFTFEVRNRRLTRDGQLVALKPKTALLLLVLLEAGGEAVSRQESDARVWPDATVGREALFFQVHLLRRALGDGDGKECTSTPCPASAIAWPCRSKSFRRW